MKMETHVKVFAVSFFFTHTGCLPNCYLGTSFSRLCSSVYLLSKTNTHVSKFLLAFVLAVAEICSLKQPPLRSTASQTSWGCLNPPRWVAWSTVCVCPRTTPKQSSPLNREFRALVPAASSPALRKRAVPLLFQREGHTLNGMQHGEWGKQECN